MGYKNEMRTVITCGFRLYDSDATTTHMGVRFLLGMSA